MVAMENEIGVIDSHLKVLYRVGGVAALVGGGFCAAQVVIEIIGMSSGLVVPTDAIGWFTLLRENLLFASAALTLFQIPAFVLFIPVFLALYVVLRKVNQGYAAVFIALVLVGTAVYLASNSAFSMLSLSDQYAAATTDAQRSMFLAAGESMLAVHKGTGVNTGISLIMIAVIIISSLMLKSATFSKITSFFGVAAGAIALVYYISLATPIEGIFILEAAGAVLLIWIVLIGIRLLRLEIPVPEEEAQRN